MQFTNHVHEFTEGMKEYMCFPDIRRYTFSLNEVHKYAYWWLEEMGKLNQAVSNETEGKLLHDTYMQLVKELEAADDYLAATLVVLRGAPIINRYGLRPVEDELSIILFDKITHRDDGMQFIYDRKEIYEAFTRYVNQCRDKVRDGLYERKPAAQIIREMEPEMAFVQSVHMVRSLIYRDSGWFILQGEYVVQCIRTYVKFLSTAVKVYRMAGEYEKAEAVLHTAIGAYEALLAEVKSAKMEVIASWQRKRNGTEDARHGYSINIDAAADMEVEADKECKRWLGTTEAMLKDSIAGLVKKLNAVHRQMKPLQYKPKNKKGGDN